MCERPVIDLNTPNWNLNEKLMFYQAKEEHLTWFRFGKMRSRQSLSKPLHMK